MERAGDLSPHKHMRVRAKLGSEHARPQEKEPTTFVISDKYAIPQMP